VCVSSVRFTGCALSAFAGLKIPAIENLAVTQVKGSAQKKEIEPVHVWLRTS
jgi:hypothetical protein